MIDPTTLDSFKKLKDKEKKKVQKVYKVLSAREKESKWHHFMVPGRPLVVNGVKARFLGMSKGRKKFPIIQVYVPGKGKEETRIHKYIGPEIFERYGIKPVQLHKPKGEKTKVGRLLFPEWRAGEIFITYALARPKTLTKLQRVLIDMNIALPLGTPDLDNLSKVQLDWSKDYLYRDDATMSVLGGIKIYSEGEPYVIVSVREKMRCMARKMKWTNLDDLITDKGVNDEL